jgi:predicted alpha/beta hydrolase family esterase
MVQQFSESVLKKIRRMGKMLNALESVTPVLAGKLAFQVFCTPRRQPLREKDAAFLATAVHGTLVYSNLKITHYSWPAPDPHAKKALLLHGWESNSGRWQQYVKGLIKAGFTVVAVDAPASGNSQGKRLNAVIFSHVVEKYIAQHGVPDVIVGHSMGGAAAVLYATLPNAVPPPKMILLGVFAESTRVIRDFGSLLGANDRLINAIYKEVEKKSGIPIEAYSIPKKAALLQAVQGLVVHDEDDAVAPVSEGRLVADAWHATFLKTTGLGHRLQDSSVVQAVVDFSLGV